MMIFWLYTAAGLVGTFIAIMIILRAERHRKRQDRIEILLRSLPALEDGAICAVCEEVRAINPSFATLHPDPIPAVLRDPMNNGQPLCARCASDRSWMNNICRATIEKALQLRLAAIS